MYRHNILTGRLMRAVGLEHRPFGPDFAPLTLNIAVKMEIWHSSFENNATSSYTEFRLFDAKGHVIAIARIIGGDS